MKEVEARSKWCPFVRYSSFNGEGINRWVGKGKNPDTQLSPLPAQCLGSGCMAWIWDSSGNFTPSGMSEFVKSTTEGSCGLAREPRGK